MHRFIVNESDLALLGPLCGQDALARKLRHARALPAAAIPRDVVTMNSRVQFTDGGVRRHAKLVYPQEADGRGRVSVSSPLGTALLGLASGQEVAWHPPGGGTRRIRVEEVLSQPEREARRLSIDERLDQALQQTFPASDAVAFTLGF